MKEHVRTKCGELLIIAADKDKGLDVIRTMEKQYSNNLKEEARRQNDRRKRGS